MPAHRAQIDDAVARAAEQPAAALRALRLEELRQLVELIGHRCAGLEHLEFVDRDAVTGTGVTKPDVR